MNPQNDTPSQKWELLENEPGKSYGKDQMVYWQGELADSFFYLKSGRVKIFLSSGEGTEKTLTLLEPGNIFGEAAFFDGLPRVSSARALEKSVIVRVSRDDLLRHFSREPEFALHLLNRLARTVRMLSDQVDYMTFLHTDQRIALQLLRLGDQDGMVRCTHEELGEMVGASRVTVSKLLGRFARAGWVSLCYGRIALLDIPALRKFVGEKGTEKD